MRKCAKLEVFLVNAFAYDLFKIILFFNSDILRLEVNCHHLKETNIAIAKRTWLSA
jgi:hypothetical protein